MTRVLPTLAEARVRPRGFPLMRQSWEHLLFLHWSWQPEVIQELLPKGLEIDTHEGRAWVGVIPFRMRAVRPPLLPPLPWLSYFHELNVRTYVRDEHGRPGVWFFSLDCDQPLAVAIARRHFHLNYFDARMKTRVVRGGTLRYEATRRHCQETALFEYNAKSSPREAVPGSLEFFLVERYRLFAWDLAAGRLRSGSVWHPPYQIQDPEITHYSTAPLRWNRIDTPKIPPEHALYVRRVHVGIYPLEP